MRAGETFSTLYSGDERSSFELHTRSFESSRLTIIIMTYLTRVNPSAEVVINGSSGQLKN